MGYSKVQKEQTHKRIVAIASKRFREKDLAGFGIAELMKEGGRRWAASTSTSTRVTN
jgi:TetR/AcrR family transcriptional regulator, transcriptional repressor for nem operon